MEIGGEIIQRVVIFLEVGAQRVKLELVHLGIQVEGEDYTEAWWAFGEAEGMLVGPVTPVAQLSLQKGIRQIVYELGSMAEPEPEAPP
jgi:hypothetical protein